MSAIEREQRMLAETLRWAGSVVLSSTLKYDEVLDRILDQVHRITAHDASCILLIYDEGVQISRWHGYAKFGMDYTIAETNFKIADIPALSEMWQTGLPVVTSEVAPGDYWVTRSGQRWVKSYVTIPIYNTSQEHETEFDPNKIVGLLQVDSQEVGFFSLIEAERLQAFVSQAAIALDNAQLYNVARREIAERMRALKQERNLISAILDTAGALMVILNSQGRIIRFNRACEQVSGFSFDEVRGQRLWDVLLPKEEQAMVQTKFNQLLQGSPPNEFESRWITKKDDQRVIAWSNTVLENNSRVKHYVVSIGIDITERKRIEEALRESEERYELAAQSANDGLWDWDLEANQIYYSPRWKELLGFGDDRGYIIGSSPIEWFSRIHPEDWVEFRDDLINHLQETETPFRSQYRILHEDGNYRWVISQGLAAKTGDGQIYRMAGSQVDVTHRIEAEQKLMHSALHDALTKLPNRTFFMEHLESSIDRAREDKSFLFAVLFLDLDRFKVINDSLGHLAGDQLLITVANRLKLNVRTSDIVARFGGDEFAILLDGINHIQEATTIAGRIQEALAQPVYLRDERVFTSASIGIAFSNIGYEWPQDILRDADTTLYRAKALGRARFEVFEVGMRTQAVEAWQLEAELRQALEQEEFEVFYQPIVAARNEQITGFEALLRWRHPERGLVGPNQFIPLAEETGLIVPMGSWVLQQAGRQLAEWHRAGYQPLRITINVSPYQFQQPVLDPSAPPTLPKVVEEVLRETGLPTHDLELEITENMTTLHSEVTLTILNHLKTMGVKLAIDDFGLGSALGFLKRFPIDTLKIDQSFVKDMSQEAGDTTFITAIITMAHSLNLRVVAEGVTTDEQAALLRSQQCDELQGYLFSRPVPVAEATRLLQKQWFPSKKEAI